MESTCPICGDDRGTDGAMRRHLHVQHRKVEILDVLLEESVPPDGGEELRGAS